MVNRPHPANKPASETFDAAAKARFWSKVSPAPADACWIWHGASNGRGYGNVGRNNKTYLAHRVAYELTFGPVPEGKDLDHLCKTKSCVNPTHLEPVSFLANMRRRYSDAPDERETHCVHGHELTPENTLWANHRTGRRAGQSKRSCRSCANEHRKEAG